MNHSKRLLCAGTGDLNRRVASLWQASGGAVIGFRRSAVDASLGFEQRLLDLAVETWPDVSADIIVIALSARARTPEAYRRAYLEPILRLRDSLASWHRLPERVIVVSSTRVYREDAGGWVDDQTPPEAADMQAQILIDMDSVAQTLPIATVSARLSGIYGPGRDWLKRMACQADPQQPPANSWTNRIHIDDAARAICHVMQLPQVATSYLVSDTAPQTRLDMFNYFRRVAGLPSLPQAATGTLSGKRIRPQRLQDSGFIWRYPDAFAGGYDEV